jgi:hypothetical protein
MSFLASEKKEGPVAQQEKKRELLETSQRRGGEKGIEIFLPRSNARDS